MKLLIALFLSTCFVFAQAEDNSNYGGQVYIEAYQADNFGQRLQMAIDAMPPEGGVINCRGAKGEQHQVQTIRIDKPVRILLGQMTLNFENQEGQNMFDIASSGVDIIGLGRSVNRLKRTGKTVLRMRNSAGDAIGGYHIYNRGFGSITIQDLDLEGVQTTLGHQYLSKEKPLNGAGGIYMERPSPGGASQSGNNISQIRLENIYIEKTKAHAIYFDTPMLSTISNVRISDAGAHGVFIYRGTSCQLQSVYVSSANYAGFVFHQHAYSSVLNSVAENCAIGWWFRSSRNITALSPGVEESNNIGLPWGTTAPYGLHLKTQTVQGDWVDIKDVNADMAREFVGHGCLVTGGESISIIGLYCKDLGNAKHTDDAYKSTKTRFLKVMGNNRNSTFTGLTFRLSSKANMINDFDVEIAREVTNCRLEWNPQQDGLVTPAVTQQFISHDKRVSAPLLLLSSSTVVNSGNTFFTPIVVP